MEERDEVQEELDKPQPNDADVVLVDHLTFARSCATAVAYFRRDLLDEGDFIHKADAHLVPVPENLDVPGHWFVFPGPAARFLVTRGLWDKQTDLERYLKATKGMAMTLLKKHEARYLGAALLYPSLDTTQLRFDTAIVLPFWCDTSSPIVPPAP
jgi:hypothetical protein